MAQKLTDKLVRALVRPANGNQITYDSTVSGFGVRITAGGAIAFILNYRVKATGQERRYTIGSYPDWNVAQAREEAKRLKREVDSGGDPLGGLKADREAPTVEDLCDRFEAEHVDKLRAHTQEDYRAAISKDIKPALGKLKVAAVAFEHVDRLHRKITQGTRSPGGPGVAPIRANRVLAVLSKMFALAIKWQWRPDNPCKGVERNRELPRKRYLNLKNGELARLTKALAEYPDQQAANIFRLLLLTGARRGEVLSAKWDQFNEGMWTKPADSTKQKAPHSIPLSAPARQLLASIPKLHNEWLFPGRGGQHHRINLQGSWGLICKAAGITGLRIHDLRHSYASTLVSAGFSLPTIGALLGHSQPQTTHRYAHLLDDPLRKATERAGAILAPKAKASGKVIKGRFRNG
jgi:integrase